MKIRTSITGCVFLTVSASLVPSQRSLAELVVDFSPATTGARVYQRCWSNIFPGGYFGEKFTLSTATTIIGGSIFSCDHVGSVGDPVRFVIFADAAGWPGTTPIIDVSTTLDVIDTFGGVPHLLMNRKHASIPPLKLPAGTYWFYMTGDGVQIAQSTGFYGDNFFTVGVDTNPDLEFFPLAGFGDVFFTLDGSDDSDGDGIPDDEDACPDSNLSETVVIDFCDSGVENQLSDDGCTIADLIDECAANANNHGRFVRCVAKLTNALKRDGIISGREKGAIQSCAGQADLP